MSQLYLIVTDFPESGWLAAFPPEPRLLEWFVGNRLAIFFSLE
jgi:hypothetical protein